MFQHRFTSYDRSANSRKAPCMFMRETIIRRVPSTFNGGEIRSRFSRINHQKPTGVGSPNRVHSSQSTETGAIFTNMSISALSQARSYFPCSFYDLWEITSKNAFFVCLLYNYYIFFITIIPL